MARRNIPMIEVNEVLYRVHRGMSIKAIVRSLGIARNTVKGILALAKDAGFNKELTLPQVEEIAFKITAKEKPGADGPIQAQIAVHHDQLSLWHKMPHMTVTQMVRLLKEQQVQVSERSLRRYVEKHFKERLLATVHLTTIPGRQAQVDFGYVGKLFDPITQTHRKAYAFVMILSHSRHRFVRFVFDQTVPTWIDCHIRAFHFYGGIPQTILIDNLRACPQTILSRYIVAEA